MTAGRTPNTALRALLTEAAWTGPELARAVDRAGADSGLALHYDRTSVAHWLTGSRPPEHVAELVAECLSRALGRQVTVSQTALTRHVHQPSTAESTPQPAEDLMAPLAKLAGGNSGTSAAARTLAYSLTLPLPSFTTPPPLPPPSHHPQSPRSPQSPGPSTAQAAELLLPLFADSDSQHGGGRSRAALATYLTTVITPALRTRTTPREHQRLLVQASRLTYLAGYMCFDEHLGGGAQIYYRTSAHLAAQAGDLSGYTTALRAMSIQAHHLGHHTHALDLAQAAAHHIPHLPTGQAPQLTAQLALATAAQGDHRQARTHLHHAEQLAEQSDSSCGTIGSYHLAALAHQRAEILSAAGDRQGAINALTLSLRHRPDDERRARALTTARLAELHLEQGHLEQACTTWHAFLDDLPHLHSARATTALTTLRARLRPYRGVSAAKTVLERSRVRSMAKPTP